MRRFGFGFFIGLVLLFLGATLAFDTVFSIHSPLLQIVIALGFIGLGVRILFGGAWGERVGPDSGEAWLADRHFTPAGVLPRDARYDIVFGRGLIDLTHLAEPAQDVTITVDTMFGASVIRVDPKLAYDIHESATFGQVKLPVHRAAPADHPPHLHLVVNTIFGSCEVVEAA